MNRGTVSMVVNNDDGALAIPFEEVEIARTVYRDGGSDYRLNRSACRLRDIVDLCRDTGLGANAYSVIEIRMIDAILSERTDERRSLFEEAAGIGKYKERRRAAIRRLETAEVDLQRVEDVIAEVRTKVRSLARQKGKAQRHRELRERRLAVEVAVARVELDELDLHLSRLKADLQADREESAGMAAALAAAETGLERTRVEQLEAEKTRVACAQRLDAVGSELSRIETEVAVADERLANGRRRLAQIAEERQSVTVLRASAKDELAVLEDLRSECKLSFTSLQVDLTERKQAADEVRTRVDAARTEARTLEEASRSVAARMARLEGDRDSARLQAAELARRLERLARDARQGAGALREVESQRDLFADRRIAATRAAEQATRDFEASRRRLAMVRGRLASARAEEMRAETQLSALEAEVAALTGLAGSDEGAASMVAAARQAFPEAVRGELSDFVRVSGTAARAVDALLGPCGSALVVHGRGDVERITRWYHGDSERGAALRLLPLDAVPAPVGPLPAGVTAAGDGAPWVRAFLGGRIPWTVAAGGIYAACATSFPTSVRRAGWNAGDGSSPCRPSASGRGRCWMRPDRFDSAARRNERTPKPRRTGPRTRCWPPGTTREPPNPKRRRRVNGGRGCPVTRRKPSTGLSRRARPGTGRSQGSVRRRAKGAGSGTRRCRWRTVCRNHARCSPPWRPSGNTSGNPPQR